MQEASAIKIISGGQTGVDRAALDFAIANHLPHGGWCTRDRKAEDGPLDVRYLLSETPSRSYAQRTKWNVRDSDGTVVFSERRETTGGTLLTLELAARLEKPLLHLTQQSRAPDNQRVAECAAALRGFVDVYSIVELNVAGPRESQAPGLSEFVYNVLSAALIV